MMKIVFYKLMQWGLGLLFLATATGKLLDNRGFAEVLRTYDLFPPGSLLTLGLILSLTELWLAFQLLGNRTAAVGAAGALAVNAMYTGLAVITNVRGLKLPNCGCFGVFLARPMTWSTVTEDASLTLMTAGFLSMAWRLRPGTARELEQLREPKADASLKKTG